MSSEEKGKLIIISGFAGAGKGTVVRKLLDMYPDRFRLSVSVTTRRPRPGEKEGVHYFFRSRRAFNRMIRKGELLEYACYVGNYYGTPRKYVEEKLDEGFDVILEIEQQGAFKVKKAMPEAVLVFLTPPTIEELERRLRGRGTETEENIRRRLEQAAIEAENIQLYDYIVINENDDVQGAAESICHLAENEHLKTSRNEEKIMSLQDGLQSYKKGE